MPATRMRAVRRVLAASLLFVPLLLAAERSDEVDRAAAALRQRFAAAEASNLTVRRDGTYAIPIRAEHAHFATAWVGPDGKVRLGCVRGAEAAMRSTVESTAVPVAPATE